MNELMVYTAGEHIYVFIWAPQYADTLLRQLTAMAADMECQFSWFDAALCCRTVRGDW